ncbi:MAG: hypothetical protein Q7R49_06385 [Candidatus Daviesbacteria bacterium]|nr:hypothetical protein [Candidatus Daviesbacteria bacterium]
MASRLPTYKNIFLALAYFKDRPRVNAVRIGEDIIYKIPTLKELRDLTNTERLKRYRGSRNDTKKFIEELVQGYREGEESIVRLIRAPRETLFTTETALNPEEKPTEHAETEQKKAGQKPVETISKQLEPNPAVPTAEPPAAQENLKIPIPIETVPAPGFIKDAAVKTQIGIKKIISRYLTPTKLASLFTGAVGAITGFGVAGPVGALVGGSSGLLFPTFIQNGGGEAVLNSGRGTLDIGERALTNFSNLESFASKITTFNKVGIVLGIAFIAMFATGQLAPTQTEAGGLTSGNLNSCKFTRTGTSLPIKSSILLGWISNAAANAGIPAPVLASVAMHENPNFAITALDTDDAIQNNQFCNKGKIFCEKNGQVLHTQANTGQSGDADPCTPEEIASGARTAQAVGLMQLLDIYNPGVDLCSITENLTAAAGKLKVAGLTTQPTQDQINSAIKAYYNSCDYGNYSYCNEVWQDLQSCKVSLALSSCPVSGGVIKTPSFQGSSTGGHCSPGYGSCPTDSRRAKAIDVDTQGQEVIFPTINGAKLTWIYVPTEITLTGNDCEGQNLNCGKFYIFKAVSGSDTWVLHLLHLDPNTAKFDRTSTGNLSGSVAGKTVPGIYLHVEIGKNVANITQPPLGSADFDPGWIPADTGMKMCL